MNKSTKSKTIRLISGLCRYSHLCLLGMLFVILPTIIINNDAYATCSVGMTTNDNVSITLRSGSSNVVTDTINVNSDCISGYSVFISGPEDTTLYKNGDSSSDDMIAAVDGVVSSPTTLLNDTYGYSIDINTTPQSNTFIGLTNTRTLLTSKDSPSASGGDDITIYYGAKISTGKSPGTYTMQNNGGITYYVVTNITATVTFDANGGSIPAGAEWEGSGNSAIKEISGDSYGTLPTPSKNDYSFLGWSKNNLPSTYQEVEYIESTGAQYIDTEYYADINTTIELTAMNTDTRTTDVWAQVTGARASYHSESSIQVALNARSNQMEIEYGTGTTSMNGRVYMPKNTKFKVRVQNDNHSIDELTGTNSGTFSGTSNYPLWIFDDNTAGRSEQNFRGRIYSYKIYENDILVRNFVPSYRIKDNEIGLYDTVNNKFYINKGTGVFNKGDNVDYITSNTPVTKNDNHTLYAIWGKDLTVTYDANGGNVDPASSAAAQGSVYGELPTPTKTGYTFLGWSNNNLPNSYQEVEYIESTGSQYINTDYYANIDTSIEIEAMNKDTRNNTNVWAQLTGARASYHSESSIQVAINAGTNQMEIEYGTGTTSLNLRVYMPNNQRFSVKVQNNNHAIDGLVGTNLGTFSNTSTYSLWIFDDDDAGRAERKFVGRLYMYKVYQNNVLVRNFVPSYRKSDNVIGLFETVNGVFYPNNGTGTFTKGNDIDYISENTRIIKDSDYSIYAIWEED